MFRLAVTDLAKRFGPRRVFSRLAFELTTGDSLAVVRPNGSGKSTLLMTLLMLYRPTKGWIEYTDSDQRLE